MRAILIVILGLWLMAPVAMAESAAAAAPKPPIREVPAIDDTLMQVAIANELRKRCDNLAGRMVRGFFFLQRLKAKAYRMGYTDDEIDAYVNSREEQDRMRRKAKAFLARQGVNPDDNSEFCAYGRDQIRKGTLIGSFLRLR